MYDVINPAADYSQPFLVSGIAYQLRATGERMDVGLYSVYNEELILIFQMNCQVVSRFGKIGDLHRESSSWVFCSDPLRTRFFLQTKNVHEAYQKVAAQYLQSLITKPVQTAE